MAGASHTPLYASAALVLLLIVLVKNYIDSQPPKGLRRVPGPRGLPLLGNTLQLPSHPQKQLRNWARRYGELYSLRLGGSNWVMVNTPYAVKEIMDKQSAVTSSRPAMPVASGLISGDMRVLLMEYSPRWRQTRAVVHKLLTPKISDTFKPSQEFEAKQLLFDCLTDNKGDEEFYSHVRRYSSSVVMTSTYGKRVSNWDSKNIHKVYQLMKELNDVTYPGAYLADVYPMLAKLPFWMQTWRKSALQYHKNQSTIWLELWQDLQRDMRDGKAPECFVRQFSESDLEKQGITEMQAAFIAGTLIEAGSETTAATLNGCLKHLANNPRVQHVANEVLTKVVGEDKTPTYEDEPHLQYIWAIVKEILRMQPVASIGAAHRSTADVIYKDFFIPKGTIVSMNMNVLHYDDRFGDPYTFRPERYMGHTLRSGAYTSSPDPYQRDHFAFGVGRRICPGMHLAENNLFITVAKMLWAFELCPALMPDGTTEETLDMSDESLQEGSIPVPMPFKLRLIPRSEHRASVIQKEWADALREGYWWGDVKVDKDGVIVKTKP